MKSVKLKKQLNLIDVYAIATGSTISGGLFIIPGLAAAEIGNSFVLAYLVSALLVIPSILSKIELSTAMPRAGGVYYFLDRSLGPLVGTIGGIGVWLVLILKVSFALVGIGAYLSLFIKDVALTPIAVGLAILLGIINFFGTKKSSLLQIVLVTSLLFILSSFIISGIPHIKTSNYEGLFNFDFLQLMSTSGMVFISYVGVTKIASISEEIQNPEKNIPLGIFLALGTSFIVYALGTLIIIGVLPIDSIVNNLTAPASVQNVVFGNTGVIIISIAAIIAFVSVANSGILSASRYPLAMSRDHILPNFFRKLTRFDTPSFSLYITVGIIALVLISFDPSKIAKLASTFQLLVFAFICLAVIVMRESRIQSYDPGYKSPLYPWMQIFGIVASLFLISQLGLLSILFSVGLIVLGLAWYWNYSKNRVARTGAIYHIFERLGRQRYEALDSELRGILKEKGLRKEDPFEEIVVYGKYFEIDSPMNFEKVLEKTSEYLSSVIPYSSDEIIQQIMEGTKIGATPVTHGFALPHFRAEGIEKPELVLVRAPNGVSIDVFNPLTHEAEETKIVNGLFFLVSPEDNPTQHLRILAKIAGRLDDDDFINKWNNARNEIELKDALLFDEEFFSIVVRNESRTGKLIGAEIKTIEIPANCLITTIRRSGKTIIPKGNTILKELDRLIIIGDSDGIKELRNKYIN
ncbi:MAG: amino acid permease [Ignavibacteriales bacterium]|nr:amino acid permease [Ignavibacteriales bacterium]